MSDNPNPVTKNPLSTHQSKEPFMSQLEVQRLNELEAVVERGLQTFYDVGMALLEIRDNRLYRQNYKTWQDYCRDRWGFNRVRADNLISAFKVVNNLDSPESKLLPDNERQIRPLKGLSPEQQREAWHRAVDTAPNGNPSNITYGHVMQIVDDMRGIQRHPETGRIMTDEAPEPQTNGTTEGVLEPSLLLTDFNYKRDMKANRMADEYIPQGYDACQTPPYAIDPLLPYLPREWRIWEPAKGEGLLVEALYDSSFYDVTGSDILTGQNFFEYAPDAWDCLITNPPYSLKYRWLERCYQLGKPFALLVPVEMLGAKRAQVLMKQYSFEIMLLNRRINFKMPNAGWNGAGSQFATMWLCWQLLPQPVMFGDIVYDDSHEIEVHDETD